MQIGGNFRMVLSHALPRSFARGYESQLEFRMTGNQPDQLAADMATRTEAARALVYSAARAYDDGAPGLTRTSAMAKLFREEPDAKQIIKLKEIYQLLESVTDKCEDVANLIEGIVLENA